MPNTALVKGDSGLDISKYPDYQDSSNDPKIGSLNQSHKIFDYSEKYMQILPLLVFFDRIIILVRGAFLILSSSMDVTLPLKEKRELRVVSLDPNFMSNPHPRKPNPTDVKSLKTAQAKMLKNMRKAVTEHGQEDLLEMINDHLVKVTIPGFSHNDFEHQGRRKEMEDAHFYLENKDSILTGVFDGHGDDGVISKYASKRFQELFYTELAKKPFDIREVFTTVIEIIHEEIRAKNATLESDGQEPWLGGCTSVVCYVDKRSNRVYTSTLADSEAKIYRKIGDKVVSIPLSVVRDWSSPKDAERASKALKKDFIAKMWPLCPPKDLRFPHDDYGVNVSRSIGDFQYGDIGDKGLSHKPKVTMYQLQPDDLLVLACDGVWDFVKNVKPPKNNSIRIVNRGRRKEPKKQDPMKENLMMEKVLKPNWDDPSLARRIVGFALNDCQSDDNITTICIRAHAKNS